MAILSLHDGLDVLERRTRTVRMALIVYLAISLADMLVVVGEVTGVIDPEIGQPTLLNGLGAIIHLLLFVVMVVAIVLVAMWIYRAHANLWAADMPELIFTPGWAVGWYFIPIASLFKPLEAMRELWAHSLAQSDSFGRPADSPLALWWGTWIVGNILSNVSWRLSSMVGGTVAGVLDMIATGALIAAGWLLLRIIETINSAQRNGSMVAHVFA